MVEQVYNALSASSADVTSIGKSVSGLDILCAHLGSYSTPQVIITAGIHARECYTALVVLRQIEVWRNTVGGVYFIPLVNPDGAIFFESGETLGSPVLSKFASQHQFWKANAAGVDLNVNFDANWGTGKQNKRVVGPSDYIGEYPFSAPESRALRDFTLKVKPQATVSYHALGGELYWEFFQKGEARVRDEKFATAVADYIGVKKVDGDLGSAGGYKDWCIQTLGIPAVTIELVEYGKHPLLPKNFADDIERNQYLPEFILNYLSD
ncbi:MAG: hypothetical protein HDT28_02190 [Clostridiales bacterium]|nr:hypothetical protein [Clostridiales bacterium]